MAETSEKNEYRVLARKYRPENFDQLIGQDTLVRTLTNAIEAGRVAHAFMLTGVRGVGKTTTARMRLCAIRLTRFWITPALRLLPRLWHCSAS